MGALAIVVVVTAAIRGHGDSKAAPATKPTAPSPLVNAAKRSSPMLSAVHATRPLVRTGCPGRMLSQRLPASFRTFPLPKGTRVVDVRTSRATGLRIDYVVGYTPLSLAAAGRHFRNGLPRSGYALTGGDAEPWEIELSFRAKAAKGAVKLNQLARCRTTVAFLVGLATYS